MKKISILIIVLTISLVGYSQTSEDYENRGIAKGDRGDDAGAIIDFTNAIEINPQDADAYCLRGISKANIGNYKGAIEDYTKSIEIKPTELAFYKRGASKNVLKDFYGAIADCNKVIENNPKCADAYFIRGLAKIALNRKEDGCLDLSRAGELGYEIAYETIKKLCQ